MKYIDELVREFLSTDELRPALMQPHVAGDKVVASNAHILIIAPIKYFKTPPTPNDLKFPNYHAVIPAYSKPIYEISLSDFKVKYEAIPKVPIYEDCDQCDGIGTVECPCCQQDTECEKCKGNGSMGEQIGIEAKDNYCIGVNGVYYNPNFFKQIVVIEFADQDKITIYAASDVRQAKGTLIIASDITMLLMPLVADDLIKAELTYKQL